MTNKLITLLTLLIATSCGQRKDIDSKVLTKELLQNYKWEERLKDVNCSIFFEFESEDEGSAHGCNLIGDPKFKYYISADTLIVEQYNPADANKKWKTGKYLYDGHSFSLIKAFEWNNSGRAIEASLPKIRGQFNPVDI